MYNYTPLTNLATSMPAVVARSVIASRNSDPPSENLTNTALRRTAFVQKYPNCDCDPAGCMQSLLGDLINHTDGKEREYFAWTKKMGFKRLRCSNAPFAF